MFSSKTLTRDSSCIKPAMRLTPARLASLRMAGLVIPWISSRKTFLCLLSPPLPGQMHVCHCNEIGYRTWIVTNVSRSARRSEIPSPLPPLPRTDIFGYFRLYGAQQNWIGFLGMLLCSTQCWTQVPQFLYRFPRNSISCPLDLASSKFQFRTVPPSEPCHK